MYIYAYIKKENVAWLLHLMAQCILKQHIFMQMPPALYTFLIATFIFKELPNSIYPWMN